MRIFLARICNCTYEAPYVPDFISVMNKHEKFRNDDVYMDLSTMAQMKAVFEGQNIFFKVR